MAINAKTILWNRITTTGYIVMLAQATIFGLLTHYLATKINFLYPPFFGAALQTFVVGIGIAFIVLYLLYQSIFLIVAAFIVSKLHLKGLAPFFWAGFITILLEYVPNILWQVTRMEFPFGPQILMVPVSGAVFGGLMALVARLRGYHKQMRVVLR